MASLGPSPSPSTRMETLALFSPPLLAPSLNGAPSIGCSSSRSHGCPCSSVSFPRFAPRRLVLSERMGRKAGKQLQVVAMAPDEEKLTRRNPLDFPIEWERPKPGRRPDIFPKFSPMKTPLPPPGPYDPPEEDEEDEEKKEEEKEEEDPDKEEENQPEKQQ